MCVTPCNMSYLSANNQNKEFNVIKHLTQTNGFPSILADSMHNKIKNISNYGKHQHTLTNKR